MNTDTARMKAIFVFAATLAFVTSPFYSPGFGGFRPEQFPIPQDGPPGQPAGYAFAIWSVIYLWLVAHAGMGLFARAEDEGWDRTRWPLIASLVIGAPWIAAADASPLVATAMIWAMLAAALAALLRAPADHDRWWLAMPIGLYAGWLTAASAVSVALIGAGWGIFGLSATAWAWIALALALAIGLWVMARVPKVPSYAAALAWALVAVAVRNAGDDLVLALAAGAAAVAVLLRSAQFYMAKS